MAGPLRRFDVSILFLPVRLVRRFVRFVVTIWVLSRLCILIICPVTLLGIAGRRRGHLFNVQAVLRFLAPQEVCIGMSVLVGISCWNLGR